jgi:hypothetical protein
MRSDRIYKDDYQTCEETFASLRIAHEALDPDDISNQLGLAPTWSLRKGEARGESGVPAPTGVWGLSTEGVIESRDLRRHLDSILDALDGKDGILENLRDKGYKMDIWCLWVSTPYSGGGPTISPHNMARLANLGLELVFDFYQGDDEQVA